MRAEPDAMRAADLRAWHSEFSDAQLIGSVAARSKASCVGVVYKMRYVPGRQIEVTIEDGSGRLTVIFTGRTSLPGLNLGSGMRVEGMVASDGEDGLQMRNPSWWHVSDPYQ